MKQNYAKIISGFILAGLLTFSSCQSTHEMAKPITSCQSRGKDD